MAHTAPHGDPHGRPPPLPVRIAGLGAALPERVVSSAEIERELGLSPGWCERTVGVRERRRAVKETTLSLATVAARRALAAAGDEANRLDLIVGASSAPQQAIPCTAALLQHSLGIPDGSAFCFDVNATCLSFPVALDLAARRIATGASQSALVFSSEATRQSLNPREPESYALIGDGAAAAVLVASREDAAGAIHNVSLTTHAGGAELTRFLGAGTLHHPNDPATTPDMNYFSMQGRAVLRLASQLLPAFLEEFFARSPWSRTEVDRLVPHQASRLGLDLLTGRCGFREEQIWSNLAVRGNCVSASIPLALAEAVEAGAICRGDRVVLLGTGAGFSMGAIALTY